MILIIYDNEFSLTTFINYQLENLDSRPNSSMSLRQPGMGHAHRPGSDMNALAVTTAGQSPSDVAPSSEKVPRPASTNPQQKGGSRRYSHETQHGNNANTVLLPGESQFRRQFHHDIHRYCLSTPLVVLKFYLTYSIDVLIAALQLTFDILFVFYAVLLPSRSKAKITI